MTYSDCTRALETSIIIVKLSNDVIFPGNYTNTKYITPGTGVNLLLRVRN